MSSCESCEIFKYTYFEEHLRMTAFAFKKAYIMHIINLAGKAYIMQVDYKATLGTTVFKNIVIRNGKKHLAISYLQLKQITIQENHNIRKYSLFCLVVLAMENLIIPLLLVTYRNQVFLYFHF